MSLWCHQNKDMILYTLSSTFTTILWANSADDKLMIFFLTFPENRLLHFMQIVSFLWRQLARNVNAYFLGKNISKFRLLQKFLPSVLGVHRYHSIIFHRETYSFYTLFILKYSDRHVLANNADSDYSLQNAASNQSLHCLPFKFNPLKSRSGRSGGLLCFSLVCRLCTVCLGLFALPLGVSGWWFVWFSSWCHW